MHLHSRPKLDGRTFEGKPCIYTLRIDTENRTLSFRLELGLIFSYSYTYYYCLGLSTVLWKPVLPRLLQKQSVVVIFYIFFKQKSTNKEIKINYNLSMERE